eukprot:gene28086-33916_t
MKHYFFSMTPEQDGVTYDGTNNTVEYSLYLTELESSGDNANDGLLFWFQRLLATRSETEFNNFIETSLRVPSVSSTCGIWGLSLDSNGDFALPRTVASLEDLVTLCNEKLSMERSQYCSTEVMTFCSTMEFDIAYSFFSTDIFKLPSEGWKEKLGPHLSKFIQYSDAEDRVILPQSKVIYTAYL